jgi:hypothetical protein
MQDECVLNLSQFGLALTSNWCTICCLQTPHICEHAVIIPATGTVEIRRFDSRDNDKLALTWQIDPERLAVLVPPARSTLKCRCVVPMTHVGNGQKHTQTNSCHLGRRLGIETIRRTSPHSLARIQTHVHAHLSVYRRNLSASWWI